MSRTTYNPFSDRQLLGGWWEERNKENSHQFLAVKPGSFLGGRHFRLFFIVYFDSFVSLKQCLSENKRSLSQNGIRKPLQDEDARWLV